MESQRENLQKEIELLDRIIYQVEQDPHANTSMTILALNLLINEFRLRELKLRPLSGDRSHLPNGKLRDLRSRTSRLGQYSRTEGDVETC